MRIWRQCHAETEGVICIPSFKKIVTVLRVLRVSFMLNLIDVTGFEPSGLYIAISYMNKPLFSENARVKKDWSSMQTAKFLVQYKIRLLEFFCSTVL